MLARCEQRRRPARGGSMGGGEDGGLTAARNCVRCEAAVSPATSHLTEKGVLCGTCFGLSQSQAHAEEVPGAVTGGALSTPPSAAKPKRWWPVLVLAVATAAGGGAAIYRWGRPRAVRDPALELMRTTLPHWALQRN